MNNPGTELEKLRKTKTFQCAFCGSEFQAKGKAKTCSPRCRKALSRANKKQTLENRKMEE